MSQDDRDYKRVEQALGFLAHNYRAQPSLTEIAESVHLSEAHFHRLFKRWVGVTPKQFLQFLTVDYARECLSGEQSVLDTAFECGLNAPARLNELFVRIESTTPAEYKSGGQDITIHYGYQETPLGRCVVGVSARGITGLVFATEGDDHALAEMQRRLPNASYEKDQSAISKVVEQIFNADIEGQAKLSVLVSGTAFQLKVWEALLRVPVGGRVSYSDIATSIEQPGASRAVGTAIGSNPVAVLIPCHRVIRGDGMLGGYRWGSGRKLALLGIEALESRSVEQFAP